MIPMLLKGVNIFPSLKAKQKLLHFLENVKLDTYMMSYVGQFQFGANEQYVDSVHLYASCCDGLSLNITCQAGAFIIDFIQDFEGDSYKNAFAEELEQLGIAYRVSEEILFETPLDHLYHGEKKEKNREKRNAFSGLRGGEVCYNDSVMYE